VRKESWQIIEKLKSMERNIIVSSVKRRWGEIRMTILIDMMKFTRVCWVGLVIKL
jgi:hypothetical protein